VPQRCNGYDLTGARIWFQFHADANGPMPEILYFNGRRVAMGDDLEPIVLFDEAKPGDKVVVAVKLLHTVDEKSFRGATLRIEFPENRGPIRRPAHGVLPRAAGALASRPAMPQRLATLNDAIAAVDLKALDAHDQAKFDASLKASQQQA
jgi:alpha-mannosidase